MSNEVPEIWFQALDSMSDEVWARGREQVNAMTGAEFIAWLALGERIHAMYPGLEYQEAMMVALRTFPDGPLPWGTLLAGEGAEQRLPAA